MAKATYKDAGVDLEVYAESMARLPRLLHRTFSPRVMRLDGGFAGLFQLDFPSSLFARNYQDPVLVSCTDGVGTKIKVAIAGLGTLGLVAFGLRRRRTARALRPKRVRQRGRVCRKPRAHRVCLDTGGLRR